MKYEFTNSWFESVARGSWDIVFDTLRPQRVLEVGSWEGASAVYAIEKIEKYGGGEICCIDTWSGGVEHDKSEMNRVEERFTRNINFMMSSCPRVGVRVEKSTSELVLSRLLAEQVAPFDFIYIDGSHQASDVLLDACIAFRLLRFGGVICFDDYLWRYVDTTSTSQTPMVLMSPKIAIDAFSNINFDRLEFLPMLPNYQFFFRRLR